MSEIEVGDTVESVRPAPWIHVGYKWIVKEIIKKENAWDVVVAGRKDMVYEPTREFYCTQLELVESS